MVVSSGRGGDGLCWDPPHWCIHKEAVHKHSVEGGLQSCVCIVHGGGDDSGDETDGALVGSRRGE